MEPTNEKHIYIHQNLTIPPSLVNSDPGIHESVVPLDALSANTTTTTTTTTSSTPVSTRPPKGGITTSPTYDSTKLLIVFMVIVFAVLLLFILIYYYCIKGMKSSQIVRQTQKSTSGSITDEKARNIFAHPERQLAVDQSQRASPSPSSVTDDTSSSSALPPTGARQTGGGGANSGSSRPVGSPLSKQTSKSAIALGQAATLPVTSSSSSMQSASNIPSETQNNKSPPQIQAPPPAPPPPVERQQSKRDSQQPPPQARRKSKSKSGSRGKDMTMVGTLANLRETLKETSKDRGH